jgi:hypothetical protein
MTSLIKSGLNHKLASISLALSILETAIVWGTVAHLYSIGPNLSLYRLAGSTWVVGTLLAVVFAAGAILLERDRRMGGLALFVATIVFFICGLPMIV